MPIYQSLTIIVSVLLTPQTIVLLWVIWYTTNAFLTYRRLRQFKGPFWASITKVWLLERDLGGQSHLDMEDICDTYGPVARIGPNDLLTNDTTILKRMLSSARSPYVRSDWYKAARMDPELVNLAAERDEKLHTERRMKMAPGVSLVGTTLKRLKHGLDHRTDLLSTQAKRMRTSKKILMAASPS
jgi:hypothetical protein